MHRPEEEPQQAVGLARLAAELEGVGAAFVHDDIKERLTGSPPPSAAALSSSPKIGAAAPAKVAGRLVASATRNRSPGRCRCCRQGVLLL